jgi:hypothetical protein
LTYKTNYLTKEPIPGNILGFGDLFALLIKEQFDTTYKLNDFHTFLSQEVFEKKQNILNVYQKFRELQIQIPDYLTEKMNNYLKETKKCLSSKFEYIKMRMMCHPEVKSSKTDYYYPERLPLNFMLKVVNSYKKSKSYSLVLFDNNIYLYLYSDLDRKIRTHEFTLDSTLDFVLKSFLVVYNHNLYYSQASDVFNRGILNFKRNPKQLILEFIQNTCPFKLYNMK